MYKVKLISGETLILKTKEHWENLRYFQWVSIVKITEKV